MRTPLFGLTLFAFLEKGTAFGVLLLISFLFSFIFSLRKRLFLPVSWKSNFWEVMGITLVTANALILTFFSYDIPEFAWMDIPMHLWGGVLVAFWIYISTLTDHLKQERFKQALIILAFVALIGVLWELFEWVSDATFAQWYNLPKAQLSNDDTMGDLFLDLFGGALTILVLMRGEKKKLP